MMQGWVVARKSIIRARTSITSLQSFFAWCSRSYVRIVVSFVLGDFFLTFSILGTICTGRLTKICGSSARRCLRWWRWRRCSILRW